MARQGVKKLQCCGRGENRRRASLNTTAPRRCECPNVEPDPPGCVNMKMCETFKKEYICSWLFLRPNAGPVPMPKRSQVAV
jgi:hypothetical protein